MTLWLAIGSLFAVNLKGGEVLYLKPNENWIIDNARFAVYFYGTGNSWTSMTAVAGETNLYKATVPSGQWTNMIFCRMNPSNSTNDWKNKWNQTGNLSYDGKNNCCSINSGQWDCEMNVKWSFYSTEPVITVLTSPEFPATTIEETATATLKYTVDNSEEKATITIDNDAFTAVDNNGTVTITFAPTEAKEYTATITIAVGEVKETVEISATGLAKDVVKDPEVLNLTAPEFAEIIEGNTTTAVATYELLNADEAEAKVEGEGFEITEQELEKVTIKFAPTKAGEYTGTLLILVAGETLKEVAFTATAKPAPYYAIRGDMTDWSDKKDIKLTPNDDKSEYFIKGFEIASGKKFKVVYVNEDNATTWYGTDKVQLEAGISNSGQGDGDIALTPAGKYDIYYKVKESKIWIQKYVEPEPEPEPVVITFVDEVTFPKTFVGETTNDIIEFTLQNAAEDAEVVVEVTGEAFSVAEVQDNIIFLAFAPEAVGEYAGVLTVTVGEVSESLEFTAVASPEEPKINIIVADFERNTAEVGDETDAAVVYSLENIESAEVEIEGEYVTFEQTEVEEGFMIAVFFRPEEVGEFPGKLTITAGEISEEIEFTFIATEPQPEIISIKVAAPENWESCYLWAWEIGGKDLFDVFPGVSMPKGEDGFYVMNLEISGPIGFMVSNGSGIQTEAYNDVDENTCFNVVSVEGNLILEVNEDCQYVAPEIPKVTFTVRVPSGTEVCYIAGTPLWSPIEMEKVEGEENMFTITTDLLNGQAWKYCAGPNFDYVELTADGGAVMDRTDYGDPDVVERWKKIYDPDFEPIDPYYAIRGLNGDASWTGSGDIKLEESADGSEWSALGFTVAEGESFKVIYIDEYAKVSGYYADLEEGCEVGQTYDDNGNLVLPAGTYDLYFKSVSKLMWIAKKDTPTDVKDAVAELIYAVDGTIFAPAPFAIIDLSGKDVTNANGSLEGTYIVKTQNSVTKVLVK